MTNKYKHGDIVPSNVLADRLDELASIITKKPDDFRSEFSMRVPAEFDRDADLVMSEAARRLREPAWRDMESAPNEMTVDEFEDLMVARENFEEFALGVTPSGTYNLRGSYEEVGLEIAFGYEILNYPQRQIARSEINSIIVKPLPGDPE